MILCNDKALISSAYHTHVFGWSARAQDFESRLLLTVDV